jgi:hypothetical protein
MIYVLWRALKMYDLALIILGMFSFSIVSIIGGTLLTIFVSPFWAYLILVGSLPLALMFLPRLSPTFFSNAMILTIFVILALILTGVYYSLGFFV